VLRPNSAEFHSIEAHYTKASSCSNITNQLTNSSQSTYSSVYLQLVLSYLIQTAKVEKTSHARVVALQSLTIYLCRELMRMRQISTVNLSTEQHSTLHDIFAVLITSVQVTTNYSMSDY